MTTTLKKLPTSYITPSRKLPASEAKVYLFDNLAALRKLIFGDRAPRSIATAHDHAEDGGEPLEQPLASYFFGPQGSEDEGGSPLAGIPLGRSGVGTDFAAYPKAVVRAPLFLPGGVNVLTIRAVVHTEDAPAGSCSLAIALRPYASVNYKYALAPVEVTAAAEVDGGVGATGEFFLEWSFSSLAALGDPTIDRQVELSIFQTYNPEDGAAHRLLSAIVLPRPPWAGVRRQRPGDVSLASLAFAEILPGVGVLFPDFASRVKLVLNQLSAALLGRAPGLDRDSRTPDRRRGYLQKISWEHRHQGILVPDGEGGFFCDGPVLREALVAHAYPRNFGDDNDYHVDDFPVEGVLLHPDGDTGDSWFRPSYRITLPAGLGTLALRVGVLPGSYDPRARLLVHVGVFPFADGASSIVTSLRCGVHRGSQVDGNGLHIVEVDADDNDAFVRAGARRRAGRGLFTLDGKVVVAALPAGVEATGAELVSEEIEISLTQPARDASETMHATGTYILELRLELQTPEAGGLDAEARLNWALVLTGREW